MGALIVLRRALGINLRQILIVVVINLGIGFVVPNIAWEAHLGGFGIGAAVAAVYLRDPAVAVAWGADRGVAGIAVGLALIVAACVATPRRSTPRRALSTGSSTVWTNHNGVVRGSRSQRQRVVIRKPMNMIPKPMRMFQLPTLGIGSDPWLR